MSALGLRSRTTQVDSRFLAPTLSPLDVPEETLNLNLFEDITLVATRTRWTHLSDTDWSWHGVVPGDMHSEITLVQTNGFISGNIRTENGDYQIRTGSKGVTIEQVDLSRLPDDEEAPIAADTYDEPGAAHDDHEGPTATDADTTVDVLVVYTKAARDGAGSEDALLSEILLAVAETNEGYTQSDVSHRVRLADAVMTDWDETKSFSFYRTLVKATDKTDGDMDEIHALRDEVGADEVVVLVEGDNSYCGIAWLMTSPSAAFSEHAFAVVARGCATGNYTFAHEMGHNMGSNHDHDNADAGAYDFSYGVQVPDAGVRSIMAYACPTSYCPRINRWSNPDHAWKGEPLGVAGEGPDAADNHKSLNLAASIVADFRDVPEEVKPTAPEILSPAPGSQLTSASVHVVLRDVEADQYALNIGNTLGGAELGQYDMKTATSQSVTGLPEDGRRIYLRAWARTGDTWTYSDASYITNEQEEVIEDLPEMVSPTEGSVLPGPTVTFKWTESRASQVVLRIGRAPAGSSLGQFGVGMTTSLTVRELPTDGEDVWVSLYAQVDGDWDVTFYRYGTDKVAQAITPAEILAPAPGATIESEAQFRWTTPCDCVYKLHIRNSEGALLFDSGTLADGELNLRELPSGQAITATLYTLSEGRVFAREYAYTVR